MDTQIDTAATFSPDSQCLAADVEAVVAPENHGTRDRDDDMHTVTVGHLVRTTLFLRVVKGSACGHNLFPTGFKTVGSVQKYCQAKRSWWNRYFCIIQHLVSTKYRHGSFMA